MWPIVDTWNNMLEFLERGGEVLQIIVLLIFVMWALILERAVYFCAGHPRFTANVLRRWEARAERKSWEAHEIRQALIAEAGMNLQQSLDIIRALVAICPLLGLLGTVTGMIEVFDVMAFMGTGSARSMASGISKATIPTMAGMVGALTGVFAVTLLERNAKIKRIHLEDKLTFDH